MEGRNHSSVACGDGESLSRMKKDLLACSRDLLTAFQPREPLRDRGKTREKPHIAVIGAGLAGLRCAEVLIDGGARVTILEARDRIGGRVSPNPRISESEGYSHRSVANTISPDTLGQLA